MSLYCRALTYQADSAALFAALRGLPCPVFLDSAHPYSESGRYDILSAAPTKTLTLSLNSNTYKNYLNFFKDLESLLSLLEPPGNNPDNLPFTGGLIGSFSYDAGNPLDEPGEYHMPGLFAGLYTWAIIVDHRLKRRTLVAHPATPTGLVDEVEQRLAEPVDHQPGHFSLRGELQTNLDEFDYRRCFDAVQAYIRAGDAYQVNLARRFEADCSGDPWEAYRQLRGVAAAPFSAYIELPESAVLSFSPERFLRVDGRQVTTAPIKGTAPRSPIPERDRELAEALLASPKDRAENLMIVDLLRNDIGQCCEPGSIRVDKLFELQSFHTVHHLVSTISGRLREDQSALSLLRACFPGGSITGAPKRRAMQIIDELEPHRRSVYCGSIAYVSSNGCMDSNIAIRTMLCEAGRLYCWSGGGIVADSQVELEFEETWNKVGPLLSHLQKMR